ncbi:GtrA family protein [Pseudomonadota bacterium]
MNPPNRAEQRQLFRFIVVGGTNTVIIYLLYLLLLYLGVQYLVALTIDYALGISLGYFMNRYWTFRVSRNQRSTFVKYSVSYIAVYLLNLILLFVFVDGMGLDERISQIPALGLATLVSYLTQRFWVFRPT